MVCFTEGVSLEFSSLENVRKLWSLINLSWIGSLCKARFTHTVFWFWLFSAFHWKIFGPDFIKGHPSFLLRVPFPLWGRTNQKWWSCLKCFSRACLESIWDGCGWQSTWRQLLASGRSQAGLAVLVEIADVCLTWPYSPLFRQPARPGHSSRFASSVYPLENLPNSFLFLLSFHLPFSVSYLIHCFIESHVD